MPDYSKLREHVSHRVAFEYDTGARIVGYLASCQPGTGPVQFVVLTSAELVDADGNTVAELDEATICPNVLTGFAKAEGPRGRDIRK
jgi:hypothetical protein